MSQQANARTSFESAAQQLADALREFGEDERRLLQGKIKEELRSQSAYVQEENFTRIHATDLESAYQLYNDEFFHGRLDPVARGFGNSIKFRLSSRMTSAAGKTFRWRMSDSPWHVPSRYEIAISSLLLFQTFDGETRAITVTGIECRDRLEAFQRIFEHELLHLVEMLLWGDSRCTAARFQGIAASMFGHAAHTHLLISPREYAAEHFGVHPGMLVEFDFEGARYQGMVNRITKRATVLVEDPDGEPFSDGNRYTRYYIPLSMLRPVS